MTRLLEGVEGTPPPMEGENEKDFVLFLDKHGKYSGEFDPPPREDAPQEGTTLQPSPPAQSAVNEETGEINWDCPCLQSALAPPCGEFFREAFSCFVASKTEPKGSDCLDKFSSMQDCFRAHPEVYLKGDHAEDDHDEQLGDGAELKLQPEPEPEPVQELQPEPVLKVEAAPEPEGKTHSETNTVSATPERAAAL